MNSILPYLGFVAVVFAVGLLPAFGPPSAVVVVLLALNWRLEPVAVVALGAVASGAGRCVLALATRRVGDHLDPRRRAGLAAATHYVTGHVGRSAAGLALFVVSPVPSAQLFEAAGLMGVRLLPVTAAHIVGRLISYSFYIAAVSVAERNLGAAFLDPLTSPVGVVIQVGFLAALVLLVRVDWIAHLPPAARRPSGSS
ncbi:hypothetical protein ACTD5D_17505 [Nocardia takedensis]|uniref:hypothetical protein n=1 Tax=Nocardia takedensis TaxID=259390 RepID=UPI0003026CD5|nr:hypothetical protein [Nocardia takedensis]